MELPSDTAETPSREIQSTPSRPSILFVDDEENVLNGLRRMLHQFRSKLDLNFVVGGEAALQMIQSRCFDVVVSDMRMPGIDGVALLKEVRSICPKTVRFALSGQADRQAVIESLECTHQYLSKPCSATELRDRITAVCAIQEALNNPELFQSLSGIGPLPISPRNYIALLGELGKHKPDLARLQVIIGSDPALSAKMLQLVNSSFFVNAPQIQDPADACDAIGIELLCDLHASGKISQPALKRHEMRYVENLGAAAAEAAQAAFHNAASAGLSPHLCRLTRTATLLKPLGLTALLAKHHEVFEQVRSLAKQEEISLHEAEAQIINLTHSELSSALLGLWGVPPTLAQVVVGSGPLLDADSDLARCAEIAAAAETHALARILLSGGIYDEH